MSGSRSIAGWPRPASPAGPTRCSFGERAWAGTLLATRVIDTVIAPMGEDLVVSARDVTERKQSEQELRLRGELLELAHDAVIVRDPVDSRVRFWNHEAETIYGYSRAEAIGRVTHELLGTVFPESREAVDQALAREGAWDGELRHRRKDGTEIMVSSRQALARDEDGRPIAIIALNSDITARKRAEEELARPPACSSAPRRSPRRAAGSTTSPPGTSPGQTRSTASTVSSGRPIHLRSRTRSLPTIPTALR